MNKVRCAIYTRKSTDEGLDQAFNSLDAQREACEAYIKSQKHQGWKVLAQHYDDGGVSGGTMARPALQRLLEEADAGRIDMIVVYKIDRLTRSLTDFAKLVERLDSAGASFVSVTQQFNTSTSMGRLTLNVLLSFAQFEREVTAERIRDKIAASKKKGMWMGGLVPLGYDKTDAGLVINHEEADTVRALFRAYLDLGCVRKLKAYADQHALRTKTRTTNVGSVKNGASFSRGRLYHLLSNPIYLGKIRHKKDVYDGLHDAVISDDLWDKVQAKLKRNAANRKTRSNARHSSPLAGKLYDHQDRLLTPSHAVKAGRRYRYYVSQALVQESGIKQEGWRIPAEEIEGAVRTAISNDRDVMLWMEERGRSELARDLVFSAVTRVQILEINLHIDIKLDGDAETRMIHARFTHRRRGVESRIVLAGASREPDKVLAKRILRAMSWLDQIRAGTSIVQIAQAESISPEYITHNLDLAFLSPKVLTAIAEGRQPPDLSAKALTRMHIPMDWLEQEAVLLGGEAVP